MWAFATLGVHHPELMAAIATRALHKGALDKSDPQAIANTVWAFASLGVQHREPMGAIAACALHNGVLD